MADKKKVSNKKTGERTYLDSEEIRILEESLEEWNGKPDKKSREAFVVASILPKIQQTNLEKFGPDNLSKDKSAKILWERRITVGVFVGFWLMRNDLIFCQTINVWLKNNKPFKNRAVFRLERQIPVRRVVAKLRRNEIEALVGAEYPNVQKGSHEYPGIYQKTLTKYIAEMSKEELKEMAVVRADWQESGPPLDVQLQSVNSVSFNWMPLILMIICKERQKNTVEGALSMPTSFCRRKWPSTASPSRGFLTPTAGCSGWSGESYRQVGLEYGWLIYDPKVMITFLA